MKPLYFVRYLLKEANDRLNLGDRFGFVKTALDRIPKPVRVVAFRPLLLVVLASHYAFLMMPENTDSTASETPSEPEEEVQEEIKIARIQTNQPKTPSKTPEAAPTAATPTPPAPTTPAASPAKVPPPRMTPPPATTTPPPAAAPPPTPVPSAAPPPAPAPSVAPPAPEPTPAPEPAPEPTPDPEKTTPEPTPEPSTDPNASSTTVEDPFVDFPFPPGAAAGSLGLLQGASDGEARNVAQGLDEVYGFYAQQLPPKNITVGQPTKNEANFRIFPLSAGNKTLHLHLVAKDSKTVILLASQPIEDLAALANAGTISVEEERFYVAVQAAGNDLSLLQFNRAQFATGYTQFVDPGRYKPEGATSEQRTVPVSEVQAKVKARLSEQGFAHTDTTYQGVPAIQATLGSFAGYVIFAPAYITPGQTATERTAVLTSTTPP